MRNRLGVKLARFIALAALVGAGMFPASASAGVGGPLILRIGTDQKLETLNPWQSITVADYEIFQLQYELLMGYDINLQTAPGFAESFDTSVDKMTWTFHIRPGMKWSDGVRAGRAREPGLRLRRLRVPGAVAVERRPQDGRVHGPADVRRDHVAPHDDPGAGLRADPPEAHLGEVHPQADQRQHRREVLQE
jgi:hypothetical protein